MLLRGRAAGTQARCCLDRPGLVNPAFLLPPEPHFLHALEHGSYVYFFFREISMEYTTLGRVSMGQGWVCVAAWAQAACGTLGISDRGC